MKALLLTAGICLVCAGTAIAQSRSNEAPFDHGRELPPIVQGTEGDDTLVADDVIYTRLQGFGGRDTFITSLGTSVILDWEPGEPIEISDGYPSPASFVQTHEGVAIYQNDGTTRSTVLVLNARVPQVFEAVRYRTRQAPPPNWQNR